MRYRSTQEIIDTEPSDRLAQVCIEIFGEVSGSQVAATIANTPEWKEQYDLFLKEHNLRRARTIALNEEREERDKAFERERKIFTIFAAVAAIVSTVIILLIWYR